MSSTNAPHEGQLPDSPSDVRALPPRPNLEFERKQAKALLASLHRGDPEALARVHAKLKQSSETKPDEFQLSDAQFTIAREYGFTSWPRLVEYFETLARHEVSGRLESHRDPGSLEAWARTIRAEHKDRRVWVAQFLGAYVPRLYGKSTAQILGAEVTMDEAKLATARMYRYPSWDVMVAEIKPYDAWEEHDRPLRKAARAIQAEDLDALAQLVAEHPELLSPSEDIGHPRSDTLARNVLLSDMRTATPGSRRIYEWLRERIDLTGTLNWMLLGHMRMTKEEMQRLLDLGADPNWVPPNGYSVLEHVIWRCWNGEIVDLIANRVKPREGLWISAGLGDAAAVSRYVDERGVPTEEARHVRPDFNALGYLPMPTNPAPDDEQILWEAFLVAAFNQRFAVMDVLLDRGFPIDYMGWGQPVLHLAVGNGWLPMVEYLVGRGANVRLKGWRPHRSARELAEAMFMTRHPGPNALRILELCGGRDPEVLRQEHDARRAKRVMPTARSVEQAFEYAKLDAREKGRAAVDVENMFLGLLGEAKLTVGAFAMAGFDLQRLRSQVRYGPDTVAVDAPAEMTANPELSAILLDARELAEKKDHDVVNSMHVMHALIRRAPASVMKIIESAGGTKERLLTSIERHLD
jgi:Clp amino terminal domain, pathogenicity island component